jgi:hypothetical protein
MSKFLLVAIGVFLINSQASAFDLKDIGGKLNDLTETAKTKMEKKESKPEEVKEDKSKLPPEKSTEPGVEPIKIDDGAVKDSPVEEPVKESTKVENKNRVSVLAGTAQMGEDVVVSGLSYNLTQKWGFVWGVQYQRANVFKIGSRGVNLSAEYLSHSSYLAGASTYLGDEESRGVELGILLGYGVVSRPITNTTTDPFNPTFTREVNNGLIGGLNLSIPIGRFDLQAQVISNMTVIGGLGFNF